MNFTQEHEEIRRTLPRAGVLPSAETRAAMDSWADRLTRVPKGVYRYASHDDMERDRDVMIDGIRVRVLSLEGLLKTKSGARPKDQIDAAAITRALDELRNDG